MDFRKKEAIEISKYIKWNKKMIIEEIQDRYENNQYLDHRGIKEDFPRLYEAAARYFKNWNNALKVAGYSIKDIKKHYRKNAKTKRNDQNKLARAIKMVYYIMNCEGVNASFLAEKLEVNRRTIVRYINELRSIPGIEIKYSDQLNGYEIEIDEERIINNQS